MNRPKPNLEKAEKELDKAVAEYPEYAAAWHMLGRVRLAKQNNEAAKEAFEKAIDADAKYLNPYDPLVRMALQQQRWGDAAEISSRLLKLNPHATEMQYFHAVAAFNGGDIEAAEKSAKTVREARDGQKFPGAQHLLGMILAKKGKFEPAATEFRGFLTSQPDSAAAPSVRRQLTEWEALGVIKTTGIASATPQP
jgi:tetratricopeptide (TPR) repeat protein